MKVRRLIAMAGLLVLAGCAEETLVGPEAQQAFEQARDRGDVEVMKDKPLLMVDGEVRQHDSLREMDPSIIHSIEVVKGSAAVAKFGERAMAGAILITTKQAAAEKKSKGL